MRGRGASWLVGLGLLLGPAGAASQSSEDSVAVVRLAAAHASLDLFEDSVTSFCLTTYPSAVYPTLLIGGVDESDQGIPADSLPAPLLGEARAVLSEATGRRPTECGSACGAACVGVSLPAPVFESADSALTSVRTLRDWHSVHTLYRFVKMEGGWEIAGRCGGLRIVHDPPLTDRLPPSPARPRAP